MTKLEIKDSIPSSIIEFKDLDVGDFFRFRHSNNVCLKLSEDKHGTNAFEFIKNIEWAMAATEFVTHIQNAELIVY